MTDDHTFDDEFRAKMDWRLWRRMLAFAKPYKRQFGFIAVVAVLTAACDVTVPLLTGRIIDEVTQRGSEARLWGYGVAFAAVMLLFTACIFCFISLAGTIATRVCYDIRQACFEKLQSLSFSYYDRRPVGWMMARLTSDCAGLSRIMGWAMLDMIWGTCMLIGLTTIMLVLNWKLGLIVMTITPVLLVVSRFFQVRLLITSRMVRKANSHVTAGFNEGLIGVRTTKSLVRERANLGEFSKLTNVMYRDSVRNALYGAVFLPLVLTICSVGVGLALWFGGQDVLGGAISIGTLVIFIAYAGQFSNPIQELAGTITMIQGAQASAERIAGLLETEPDVQDAPDARSSGGPLDRPIEHIEFEHVGFTYKGGQRVLSDFDLTIEPGETIALVGPTGGGKTTIVSLLCRFYEPTTGKVLINGVDYRQATQHWLQSRLGIVLQQPHLFNTTVRQNIRYGKLDASDDDVEAAARLVNAHDFITKLDDGYDTDVGEGGNRLSTGQKQLVALARAILADPDILVMDEATSSVDTETEKLIQSAVERALENRIAVVIAHRLSTIRSADRILVVEHGRIIEHGTHEQLLARRGRYFELSAH